jgi:PIN domain nuclease of toxin-antitoxin system
MEPERLTTRAAAALESEENELWLSPVSVWELLLLFEKGRLDSPLDPVSWIRDKLELAPMREASLNHEVALQTLSVRIPHRDLADRLLAATARVYELTLVTADERLIPRAPLSDTVSQIAGRTVRSTSGRTNRRVR